MAQKIKWNAPEDTSVISTEINRASTLYGTYSVLATIDATSDGAAKTSANTWVVTYTDQTGTRTDWYKIRFFDGTNYSEYSDPTTSEELLRLCTVSEVKEKLDTVGRWTDDEVFNMITEVDDLIYIEMGTPIQASYSPIGTINSTNQDRYYVGEEDIYRVDRVFYGTTSKTELYLDDKYKANNRYGMVQILPVASSGITLNTDCSIEMQYVPRIFNKLAIYRTMANLLEKADTTTGGNTSKELEVAQNKLDMVETIIANRFALETTSHLGHYDGVYGVNRKKVTQNFDRNRYVGSTGW